MADDPLHDNDRSPRREKVTKRETITEREGGDDAPEGERGYLGGDKEPGETTMKRDAKIMAETHSKKKNDSQKDADEDTGAGGEPDMKMRREMFKRHETEMNDTHALHLKAMKDMQRRHAKELGTIFKQGGGAKAKPDDLLKKAE